jgi:hypothetical protein
MLFHITVTVQDLWSKDIRWSRIPRRSLTTPPDAYTSDPQARMLYCVFSSTIQRLLFSIFSSVHAPKVSQLWHPARACSPPSRINLGAPRFQLPNWNSSDIQRTAAPVLQQHDLARLGSTRIPQLRQQRQKKARRSSTEEGPTVFNNETGTTPIY